MTPAFRVPRLRRGAVCAAGLAAALVLGLAAFGPIAAETPARLVDPPGLAERVASGALAPVEQRVPTHPSVVPMTEPGQSIGQQGGAITMLMSTARDVRMMVVYGYARLVGYDRNFQLVPDLLESFEVEEGRIFTFHLRPGHKWSDGQPFTTEDFRYFWEDVANNQEVSPTGPPLLMVVEGEPAKVEILDETTIRYSWSKPNPDFLPAIAGPSPLYVYRPSHYLKTFHTKYADAEALAAMVEESGQQNWAALHNRMDNMYRNDNVDLPTLEPWVLATKPPSERFVFERNPYYHRIDPEGRQLPYLDRVMLSISDSKLIPAKAGAGEADLQARSLRFDNYTFLKEGEERGNYRVLLWDAGTGSAMTLYPNLNATDPVWRQLIRDVRFRRALSMAIDRSEINQAIYHGLGLEAGNTMLPQSPLFSPEYQTAWARFDPEQANALLDEIGLDKRDDAGTRLLPDGRPLEIVVESAGQVPEEADVLELMRDSWKHVGIKLFHKATERDVLRNRVFSGETIVSVWSGLENGLATPDMSPWELAPTTQQQLQWPKWGEYTETAGASGEPVDMPEAQELERLKKEWHAAADMEARMAVWQKMLAIHADQVFTIGTIAGVPQPVVVKNALKNVPETAVYSWEPGAHFGIYKPDTFWLAGGGTTTQ